MLLNGVLTSELVARWRKTVSAATNPPGVMVTPLYLMDAGPVSSDFLASACAVATVVRSVSLLTFRSLTVEFSELAAVLTSAVVLTASAALLLASMALALASTARAFAAAAASRASSIWRSRLASSSFNNCNCSCCDCSVCRSSSSSAANFASPASALFAAFAFAALAGLADLPAAVGWGSASFGVSASAVPPPKKMDRVSAESFFIASLFETRFDPIPVSMRTTLRAEGKGRVLLLRQTNVNILQQSPGPHANSLMDLKLRNDRGFNNRQDDGDSAAPAFAWYGHDKSCPRPLARLCPARRPRARTPACRGTTPSCPLPAAPLGPPTVPE